MPPPADHNPSPTRGIRPSAHDSGCPEESEKLVVRLVDGTSVLYVVSVWESRCGVGTMCTRCPDGARGMKVEIGSRMTLVTSKPNIKL